MTTIEEIPPPTMTLGQHRHLVTARRIADMLRDLGPMNASDVERRANVDHEGHPLIDANGRPIYPRSVVQDALLYLTLRGAIERSVGNRGATLYSYVSDDLIEDAGPKPAPPAPRPSGEKHLGEATLDEIEAMIAVAIARGIGVPSVETIEATEPTAAAKAATTWDDF